jgi:hypothetical protein
MRPALQPPPDELSELRQRVAALARELEDVRSRLDELRAETAPPGPAAAAPAGALAPGPTSAGDLLPLLGRAFLVLGGAFLVRAFTEAGTVSPGVGVAGGFAYALAFVLWAQHGARRGRPRQGLADGVAAALIVFPLLWESAGRFGVFGGAAAAAALAVSSHALLAAALRSAMPALAWVAALGAVVTAFALVSATHALVPVTLAVLLLALTTRAVARARAWAGLGWPALAGAALLVCVGVLLTTGARGLPDAFASLRPAHVIALALGLPGAVALASAVPRHDRSHTPLSGVVQVAAAVAVGYAGALRVAWANDLAQEPLAAFGVAAAAAALVWGESRRRRQPVHADASTLVSLAVGLYASALLLGPAGRAIAWSAAGAALCATFRSPVLGWTGAALLALAAVQAGVVTGVLRGLGGGVPVQGVAALGLAAVVLAATLCARWALARGGEAGGRLRDALAVLALAPIALLALAAASSAVAGGAARRSASATAVLAVTALVLAALVRAGRPFGPRWVAYAALGAGGLKLVLSDLRQGTPVTLFVAFGLYGMALILTSRMMRRPAAGHPAAQPPLPSGS